MSRLRKALKYAPGYFLLLVQLLVTLGSLVAIGALIWALFGWPVLWAMGVLAGLVLFLGFTVPISER